MKISIDTHDRRQADSSEPIKKDYVALAEDGYCLEGSDADWLALLMRRAKVLLGAEVGMVGWGYRLRTEAFDLEIRHPTFLDCPNELPQVMDATTHELGERDHDRALVRRIYHGPPVLPSISELGGPGLHDADQVYYQHLARVGIGGFRCFRAESGNGSGVFLCAFRKDDRPLNRAQVGALERSATHLAAGYRLRHALLELGADAPPSPLDVDAVLSTDGEVQHAEGEAKSNRHLDSLKRAAGQLAQCQRLRHDEPARAIALWKGLVSGRWSLIGHFDSDGKRMLLARRNPPGAEELGALTAEERAVASYAACGHSNKLIAYEVGLHESTVSRRLESALKKLGFTSRVELVATMTRARLERSSGLEN